MVSQLNFKAGNLKEAWLNRNKKDSLVAITVEASKVAAMLDIQTKYETDKKDKTINILNLQKQIDDNRIKTDSIIIILSILSIFIFIYFYTKLRSANANLLTLQKSRDKLFTIISHDLRSPISNFQNYSNIIGYLIKTKQYNRVESTIEQVDQIGFNLSLLLDNLLKWSLSQQNKIISNPNEIKLKNLFENLLPIYNDMANLKAITIIDNIANNTIFTDQNSLLLILRNLLDNAIKFTPEGGQIRITTIELNQKLQLNIINTSDNIPEIKKRKIKSLFESKKEYDFGEADLGIGLILIKQFADRHKIGISFDQDKEGQTEFSLLLPLKKFK